MSNKVVRVYFAFYLFPLSDSVVCESAASGPTGAALRSPTEAPRSAAQAAGRAGGAGAEDEGTADGERG